MMESGYLTADLPALLAALTSAQRETWSWLLSAASLGFAIWQAMPRGTKPSRGRRASVAVAGAVGLVILWAQIPRVGNLPVEAGFWAFAAVTLFASVATVSSRSPVYCAIWFALALLGTAGLMLLQGAQFLGIATVAVYAGAIVVTFLFVLMLAQPEGHAFYDRIGWGGTPTVIGAVAATLFVMLAAMSIVRPDAAALTAQQQERDAVQTLLQEVAPAAEVRAVQFRTHGEETQVEVTWASSAAAERDDVHPADDHARDKTQSAELTVAATPEALNPLTDKVLSLLAARHPDWMLKSVRLSRVDVSAADHAAHLGAQLFSRHLITVQAAGTLLMAALVAAVAVAARGGDLER